VIGVWKGHGITFCAEAAKSKTIYDFNLETIPSEPHRVRTITKSQSHV